MNRIPITQDGLEKLKQELDKLKSKDRKEVVIAIAEARAHGDLSENAEYSAARERQGMIEAKIKDLEVKMQLFEVIDMSKCDCSKVQFGVKVLLLNLDDDSERTYRIVGPDEANIDKGEISVSSPIASAIIGKEVGDIVEVEAPGGSFEYEVLEITI